VATVGAPAVVDVSGLSVPGDGGPVLNAAADGAIAGLKFPNAETRDAFRACALGQMEICVNDQAVPTVRRFRLRDVLMLAAGVWVGFMVGGRIDAD
tara:strand:+ start:897 stop:1184 length:288 start_codon:yes stop_codon:yes gene_type:complete